MSNCDIELQLAIDTHDLKRAIKALKKGAKTSSHLMQAAERGQLDITKELIKYRANINENHDAALCFTAQQGHKEVVELLLENGADISARRFAPIRWAEEGGKQEMVELLISELIKKHKEKIPKATEYVSDEIFALLKKKLLEINKVVSKPDNSLDSELTL